MENDKNVKNEKKNTKKVFKIRVALMVAVHDKMIYTIIDILLYGISCYEHRDMGKAKSWEVSGGYVKVSPVVRPLWSTLCSV